MRDNEPTDESTSAAGSCGDGLSNAEPGTVRPLPTVSLELFPPRPGKAASATWGRIDRLLATGPDFVSVTYRPTFVSDPAGGNSDGGHEGSPSKPAAGRCDVAPRVRVAQERTNPSEYVLAHVLESSTIPLMAHLTCIGYCKQEAVDIVTRFLRMGVRRFLALRGDPPAGTRADDVAGELRHADDLVRVIREVEADFFGDGRRHITIAVAAYPAANDHIEAIEVLAAKQAAGADLAITQVFYDAADYVALTNAASYAGVSIPILPGVIPLTDLRRLTRLEALTGVRVPESLRSSLGSASGATLVERGIGATLDLATALLRAGLPDCTCTPSTALGRPSMSSATCVWVASWPEPRPTGKCATPSIAGISRPPPVEAPPSCAAALPVQHSLPATLSSPTPPSPRRTHERHP